MCWLLHPSIDMIHDYPCGQIALKRVTKKKIIRRSLPIVRFFRAKAKWKLNRIGGQANLIIDNI